MADRRSQRDAGGDVDRDLPLHRGAAADHRALRLGCGWQASSRGGILTILNQTNYKPAPIRYSVVWMNTTTITVFGDVFHKIGN